MLGLKILVTGARGFIGSRLHRALHEMGADVHAVSRTAETSEADGPRWWHGDLADIQIVRNILSTVRPDVVFHLAGQPTTARDLEMVLPTFHSNLTTTINLLTVATEIGCRRIIVTGSLEEPYVDCGTIVPSSPYGAAKWAGGVYAQLFYRLYKTPVVIARIFLAYGPGPEKRSKIIPYVIRTVLQGEAPKLGSGRRLLDWIYIDDVVDGLLAVARAPDVEGCTIDLGSGEMIPIREVVDRIVQLIGAPIKPSFGALPERPGEEIRAADVAYAQAKLGWKAATSLEEGLVRTVAWYREQPLQLRDRR
ncbi:MAG: NAD-dependent epimerase/dehydratase family protein [Candidatus Binatia bacterium]